MVNIGQAARLNTGLVLGNMMLPIRINIISKSVELFGRNSVFAPILLALHRFMCTKLSFVYTVEKWYTVDKLSGPPTLLVHSFINFSVSVSNYCKKSSCLILLPMTDWPSNDSSLWNPARNLVNWWGGLRGPGFSVMLYFSMVYIYFLYFFGGLQCVCHSFCLCFERCINSNPESCRSKQACYQLNHSSPPA